MRWAGCDVVDLIHDVVRAHRLVRRRRRRRRRRRGRGANALRPREVVVRHAPRPTAGAELGHRAQPPPIIGARFGRCRPRHPCCPSRVAYVICVLRVAKGGRPRQIAASRPHLPIGGRVAGRKLCRRPHADGHLGIAVALHAYGRGQDRCWIIAASAGVGHIVQLGTYSGYEGQKHQAHPKRRGAWRCRSTNVCHACDHQNVCVAIRR